MTSNYTLVVNGKPEGPYSIDELKAMKLKPGDFVKTPEMDDYKEAHEVAELRSLFGFKLVPLAPQYFGSFDQRLMAAAVDWLLVSGVFFVLAFLVVIFIPDKRLRLITSVGILALIPIAKLIYSMVMESSKMQATYGKKLLNIKVCNEDGSMPGVGTIIGRNIAKVFSVGTFFLGYLLSFFNKKQQCLHDMFAGTVVMKDRLV